MKKFAWSAAVLRRIICLLVIIRFFRLARYRISFIDQGKRVQKRVAIFFPDEIRIGSLWETPRGHLYAIVDDIPYAIDESKDRPEVLAIDGIVVSQGL